jgi:predicted SnoaL-like aldol condensation-catalyzing enzyme
MSNSNAEKNKAIVLEAFDTLFNRRDYTAAERFWSPNYIQHSAHIEPGRDGLFNLIKAAPPSLKYEPGVILAEDDYVIVHGRFSNIGLPVNWIAADVVRLKERILVEHWDVIQDEATKQQSKSGKPTLLCAERRRAFGVGVAGGKGPQRRGPEDGGFLAGCRLGGAFPPFW